MDNMDIAILLMASALVILHGLFGYRALNSTALIDPTQKLIWSLISFTFGPAGYFFYQCMIPCDKVNGKLDN